MYLIVGLGNPTPEYETTKHNLGFIIVDNFASSHDLIINKRKFNGDYVKTSINNKEVILLKPQMYMNLSGEVIKKYIDYFNIDLNKVLVISDDLDQPIGSYKLKEQGSSGGHNGLKNIEQHLKTQEYKRLKVGIHGKRIINRKSYVLKRFSKQEQVIIEKLSGVINELLDDYLTIDFEKLMSIYNDKTRKNI